MGLVLRLYRAWTDSVISARYANSSVQPLLWFVHLVLTVWHLFGWTTERARGSLSGMRRLCRGAPTLLNAVRHHCRGKLYLPPSPHAHETRRLTPLRVNGERGRCSPSMYGVLLWALRRTLEVPSAVDCIPPLSLPLLFLPAAATCLLCATTHVGCGQHAFLSRRSVSISHCWRLSTAWRYGPILLLFWLFGVVVTLQGRFGLCSILDLWALFPYTFPIIHLLLLCCRRSAYLFSFDISHQHNLPSSPFTQPL